MNRVRIEPVGVFTAKYGPSDPTLYVLLVHKSLESVAAASARLLADDQFAKSDFVNTPLSDPGYVRVESSLMAAFKDMPKLTYMLCFDDLADRDKRWGVFGESDEWKKLSSDPQYKDTVSNITDIILQPTGYSQI